MASLARDLRYALRMLRRSPGYTSIAILTLAISIGANTAIFSFVDGVLLKPLPYRDADRIVRVMEKPPQGERNGISTLNFLDWQRDNTVFDFLAAQTGGGATLTGVTEPVQLRGGRVSADFFRIFGIEPALGRTFAHDEDQPSHLIVQTEVCSSRCGPEYGHPCTRFCPANVYEIIREPGQPPRLQINASNCVHCKTCDIMDPYQLIDWVPPEGGGGPRYDGM